MKTALGLCNGDVNKIVATNPSPSPSNVATETTTPFPQAVFCHEDLDTAIE
jgi:hypothetical protein